MRRLKQAQRTLSCNGFTLVEVLLALAISALLLTATLATVANLAKAQTVLESGIGTDKTTEGLRVLFAADAANSSRYRPTANGFELTSMAAMNDGTLDIEHLPCTVAYEVRQSGTESVLVRIQRQDGKPEAVELACLGVVKVSAAAGGDGATPTASVSPGSATDGWRQVGDSFNVTVTFKGSKPPLNLSYRNR